VKNLRPILFCNFPVVPYDANGNTTAEGGVNIQYNLLNLPQIVQLPGGRSIQNIYAAGGRKLKTITTDNTEYTDGTKTYNGNLVFDRNGELEYILFDEGRILHDNGSFTFEYHLRDHLGSTRVAFLADGTNTVVQENAYYPFGAPVTDLSWSGMSDNRYKREGKEYISDFDWNKYDFTGRTFDSWNSRALQVDPMAEKYYGMSPYALWGNSPMRFIDPTGMRIDDIPEDELDMKTFDTSKDRVVLDEIVITGEQSQGWWSSLWNSIRPLFDFFDFTGKGETQTGGIHFVSSSGGAAPTKTSALNAVETINIDDLLPAIGAANAGPFYHSPLDFASSLKNLKGTIEEMKDEKSNEYEDKKQATNLLNSSDRYEEVYFIRRKTNDTLATHIRVKDPYRDTSIYKKVIYID
jgi:RHS repeat-associated protein